MEYNQVHDENHISDNVDDDYGSFSTLIASNDAATWNSTSDASAAPPLKLRTLYCPCCPRKSKEPFDIIRHIESGECASGVTKQQLSLLYQDIFRQIGPFFICPNNNCMRRPKKLHSLIQHLKFNERCKMAIHDDFVDRMIADFLKALDIIMEFRKLQKDCLVGKDLVEALYNW